MRLCVFSAKSFEQPFFDAAAEAAGMAVSFVQARLTPESAPLARGSDAACCFVNDDGGIATIDALAAAGVRHLALRSAGWDHVDRAAAASAGVMLSHVPSYSPRAVAEHALALLLALDRQIHRAHERVRRRDFSLDGLVGFNLAGKVVGVVGAGRIGAEFARFMLFFGCRVLVHDPIVDDGLVRAGATYTSFDTVCAQADVISLHCPLNEGTRHLVDARALAAMKPGVVLINTGRGALVDTAAMVDALAAGRIGYAGLDAYAFARDR